MKKIFTIGETVLDIIFKHNEPRVAKAGGSALNTSVTLGRLGLPVSFITELGTDRVGEMIIDFLRTNNVSVKYIYQFNGQSAVALAFLDENNNATYTFYKNYPEKRLELLSTDIIQNDIVLYCSSYALDEKVRNSLLNILTKAGNSKAILIYDPNIRKAVIEKLNNSHQIILEKIALADIIRGSDEDFEAIFGTNNSEDTYNKILKTGCKNLIYTANRNGVFVHTKNFFKNYNVPEITPVSTIGAGDNFNAGIIYGLSKLNIQKAQLNELKEDDWDIIIKYAIQLAVEVCMNYDNYVSSEFAKQIID